MVKVGVGVVDGKAVDVGVDVGVDVKVEVRVGVGEGAGRRVISTVPGASATALVSGNRGTGSQNEMSRPQTLQTRIAKAKINNQRS